MSYFFTVTHRFLSKSYRLIILAGAPTATEKGGISRLTTEFAPMTECLPMVTLGKMKAWAPIQHSFLMRTCPPVYSPET